MQNSIYFGKVMRISQSYNEGNHIPHSIGNVRDYPIDETYGIGKKGCFYAPFDCVVSKKYKATTNQVWITSLNPVKTPTFIDYVTIFIGHINTHEFNKIYEGKIYRQKELILHEEKDKLSTGYHNHVSCGRGKIKGTGWLKNNKNVWVLNTTKGCCYPENVFYIDKNFTKVQISKGLNFKYLDTNISGVKYYKTLDDLYINKTMNVNNHELVKNCSEKMKKALKYSSPNSYAVIKKGTIITALETIEKNNYIWIKNYNGYVVLRGKSGRYFLTEA